MSKTAQRALMKAMVPKNGQLFVVIKDDLFISGGDAAGSPNDISVPKDTAIMFIGALTYEEALKEKGYSWDSLSSYNRIWSRHEKFWSLLCGEHVLQMPVSDACDFLIPATKRRMKKKKKKKLKPAQDKE